MVKVWQVDVVYRETGEDIPRVSMAPVNEHLKLCPDPGASSCLVFQEANKLRQEKTQTRKQTGTRLRFDKRLDAKSQEMIRRRGEKKR